MTNEGPEKQKRETGADDVPFLKIIYNLNKNTMQNVFSPLAPINIEGKLTHGLEFFVIPFIIKLCQNIVRKSQKSKLLYFWFVLIENTGQKISEAF